MSTKTKTIDKIANTLVERMFFICADDSEVNTYFDLLETPIRGHGLATSYASRKVTRQFVDLMEARTGLDYSEIINKVE